MLALTRAATPAPQSIRRLTAQPRQAFALARRSRDWLPVAEPLDRAPEACNPLPPQLVGQSFEVGGGLRGAACVLC